MSNKIHLLIIDPQKDFCDPKGSLFVPGAVEDMSRLASFITRVGKKIDKYHVTLDSHHYNDLAHPQFWVNTKDGSHPAAFQTISVSDVEDSVYIPAESSYYDRMLNYVKELRSHNRYPLTIWPPHCLTGSEGQAVVPELFDALRLQTASRNIYINWVTKGSNPLTEHYSAVKAEVPDPKDPSTDINTDLINTLQKADTIVLAGEALNFCVKNTLLDVISAFGNDKYLSKFVMLTDATSPVPIPGYEKQVSDMMNDLVHRGMKTSTTVDFLT